MEYQTWSDIAHGVLAASGAAFLLSLSFLVATVGFLGVDSVERVGAWAERRVDPAVIDTQKSIDKLLNSADLRMMNVEGKLLPILERTDKLLQLLQTAADENYWDAKAQVETVGTLLRNTDELVTKSHQVLGEVGPLLRTTNETVTDLRAVRADVKVVLDNAARDLETLNVTLIGVNRTLPSLQLIAEGAADAMPQLRADTLAITTDTRKIVHRMASPWSVAVRALKKVGGKVISLF